MSDDKPINRRGFFLQGLREILKPVARAIEPIEDAARTLGEMENQPEARKPVGPPPPSAEITVRPPAEGKPAPYKPAR